MKSVLLFTIVFFQLIKHNKYCSENIVHFISKNKLFLPSANLIIVFYTIIFNSQDLLCQQQIPDWFFNVPDISGHYVSVGYSGVFTDSNQGYAIAKDCAIKKLTKQVEVDLEFSLNEKSDGHFVLTNISYHEKLDSKILSEIRENCSTLDSLNIDGHIFMLVCFPSYNGKNINTNITRWGEKPKWIEDIPKSKKWVYGIGSVSNYAHSVNGWYDSEETARFTALQNLIIDAKSGLIMKRYNYLAVQSSILNHSINKTINGSKIIRRWYDRKKDVYYSLCKMPVQ